MKYDITPLILSLWLINLVLILFLDHHHNHVYNCFMHASYFTILFALQTCFAYSRLGCSLHLMMYAFIYMLMLQLGIFLSNLV
jgi:hypothetical protein